MSLVIYNTLSREKEPFATARCRHVRIMSAGRTVYDYVHVGNGRPVVVFDVLCRLLKRRYPRVTYCATHRHRRPHHGAGRPTTARPSSSLTTSHADRLSGRHEQAGRASSRRRAGAPRSTSPRCRMIHAAWRQRPRLPAEATCCSSVPSMSDYGRLSRHHARRNWLAGARVDVRAL